MADEDEFASGLPAARDWPMLEQPAGRPGFGENHAFWITTRRRASRSTVTS